MTRTALALLFAGILLAMSTLTIYASLDRSVVEAGGQLILDPWFQATLFDAYFGFLTFYVWVAYKESGITRKSVWFVLIMGLGNIAMSAYVLIQLKRWDSSRGIEALLTRNTP